MTVFELIQRVESAGGRLSLRGAKVVCRLPEDVDHALIELLREQREAVARELRLREEYLGKGNHGDGGRDTRREGDAASHAEDTAPTSRRLPPEVLMGSEVIAMIKKEGGEVWLDEQGRVRAQGISGDLWAILRQSEYLVRAILRDQIASQRRENTNEAPHWWRHPETAWTYPEQKLKPFSEIVRIWVAEQCVAAGNVSSNLRILHREFSAWAGFDRDATSEQEFLQQLAFLGYRPDDGWVEGICLREDYSAAYGATR